MFSISINMKHMLLTLNTFYRRMKLVVAFAVAGTLLTACESPGTQPTTQAPSSNETSGPIQPSVLTELDKNIYLNAVEQLSNGEYKKSEKTLVKLEKKYPHHQGIKINLATSYYQQKAFVRAKEICEQAMRSNESSPEIFNLLGLISVENKEFITGQQHYQRAIALNDNFANAHYNLALLYDIYFQDIPKAYQHYEKYLKLVPNDTETTDWLEQLKYSLDQ